MRRKKPSIVYTRILSGSEQRKTREMKMRSGKGMDGFFFQSNGATQFVKSYKTYRQQHVVQGFWSDASVLFPQIDNYHRCHGGH